MPTMDNGDIFLAQPENPGGGSSVVWFDTEDGTFKDYKGFTGDFISDVATKLVIETAAKGQPLRRMNGDSGQTMAANEPQRIRIGFTGYRTRVSIDTDDEPEIFHANGRITKDEV